MYKKLHLIDLQFYMGLYYNVEIEAPTANIAGAFNPIKAERTIIIIDIITSVPIGPFATLLKAFNNFSSPFPALIIAIKPNRSIARILNRN